MKLAVVAVYDSVAEFYHKPVFWQTPAEGVRSFEFLLQNDKEIPFSKHPEHYSLFHLGSFDPIKGSLVPLPSPVLLRNAWEVVKQ